MSEFNELKQKYVSPHHKERRAPVNAEMSKLIGEGKNCFSCEGLCCTFLYNSMQVTPLEALDAYTYLSKKNRINDSLIKDLKECIKKYRLDIDLNMGRKSELRKHYTCPFFNSGPKGCSISPDYKPYGCLGFNPLEKNVKTEGKCTSYLSILEKRELYFDEESMNMELREKLNLYWDKKNFPMAILILIEKLGH